jgi:hypothetical protein
MTDIVTDEFIEALIDLYRTRTAEGWNNEGPIGSLMEILDKALRELRERRAMDEDTAECMKQRAELIVENLTLKSRMPVGDELVALSKLRDRLQHKVDEVMHTGIELASIGALDKLLKGFR